MANVPKQFQTKGMPAPAAKTAKGADAKGKEGKPKFVFPPKKIKGK